MGTEDQSSLVEEHNTYNADPSKSRLVGTCMSEKKFTLTEYGSLLATRMLPKGLLEWMNIPRIPCSVQLEILPVMISPLKGRKTIRRNSTISSLVHQESPKVT